MNLSKWASEEMYAIFIHAFSHFMYCNAGFHLATKISGGSEYIAHQVPWDVFLGEFVNFLNCSRLL